MEERWINGFRFRKKEKCADETSDHGNKQIGEITEKTDA